MTRLFPHIVFGIALLGTTLPAIASEAIPATPCENLRRTGMSGIGITLPDLAARRAQGRRIRIVVLGSSSTEGPNTEDRSRTFPAAAERRLRALWGTKAVEIVNKGVGGEALPEMLRRFDHDIFALKPDLVVWQLGVNDLFRDKPARQLEPAIRTAVQRIRARGIPVVLFDLQYAPRVLAARDHAAMERVLGEVAKQEGAGLFRRFTLMQALAGGDAARAGGMTEKDGLHMTASLHACMGSLLGEAVAAAAQQPRQDVARRLP